ncbi:hypothetical protein FIBSPDRAFT_1047712 [Athelia psychrophila]|uniref:Uncharacterized protein n=1 Tax=Athelia psychrophila TaxID=1759441 RepID=A0A166ESP8_9AGAM|nr:hypothetical protein FIBSPDRAFT_1047712 [Fibularhizoctonia sp. CBS 109695]
MKPSTARKERPSKGKGKQPKQFLQRKEAVALAASIADGLDVKSQDKVARLHQPRPGDSGTSDRKTPKAKDRIKEKKAVLHAQKAKLKKEKVKQKKLEAAPEDSSVQSKPVTSAPRKRVTFA